MKERHGSMRVPPSLVTTFETLEFGRQGMPISVNRLLRNGRVVFRLHGKCGQEDVGAMHDQLWDDRHVEVFPSVAPYVKHEGFESGTCSQGLPRYAGFEQQRRGSRRGGEALLGASLPPWKALATRKNHDGTSDSCSGCSSGTSDSFGRVALSPSWLVQANPPPLEASGNPWHVLSVKSPPNSEEQWKRRDSPIPSRLGSSGL